MSNQTQAGYSVIVFDMARTGKSDGERIISGFETLEAATDYAIARVRASVEELRGSAIPADELKRLWTIFGEDCRVLDSPVRAGELVDMFIAAPAQAGECDWPALAPRLRRFRATLLISNANNESVWAGGFFRSTVRLSGRKLLERYAADAKDAFRRQGIAPAEPVDVHVANHFELPDPPQPPAGDARPLKSWRVTVDFVCHDVKFGSTASGVFAWPDEPAESPLRQMTFLLMADQLAARGDGPDYANYSDVLGVRVAAVDDPPDYPMN